MKEDEIMEHHTQERKMNNRKGKVIEFINTLEWIKLSSLCYKNDMGHFLFV